jgi:ureidoglycolate hydrolase
MKNQLLKKLSAFITTAMLFSASANAQIVYTDVNPDTTITQSTNGSSAYSLDMNNDGITDVTMTAMLNGTVSRSVQVGTSSGSQVLNYSAPAPGGNVILLAKARNNNAIISSTTPSGTNSIWSNAQNVYFRRIQRIVINRPPYYANVTWGDWSNNTDRYLAVRISVAGAWHYGWVRLSVIVSMTSAVSFTIRDYAYNSIPNQPILAGETSCTVPTVTLTLSGSPSICSGSSVQFNSITNSAYLFQWFKDGNAIAGANSSSYTAFSAGAYFVKASNSCGDTNSTADTVTVFTVDTSITVSGNTLAANAANATYQWMDCTTMQIIPGATAQTFLLPQNGSFAVIVAENGCNDTSSCYTSCFQPIVAIAPNGPTSICRGDSVQFNATTNLAYLYQWYKDGNAIPGANSATYTAFSAGAYYVNVSDSCGNANSTVDTVSVLAVDTSVTAVGNTLTANAASAIYQWIDCTTMQIIPGATAQTFLPSNNGSFAVIVTENGCDDTSSCYLITSIGLLENGSASTINLFPNPATNHVTIDLGNNNQKVEVIITDVTGKIIYAATSRETQKIEVSTHGFKAGIYVVHIQTAEFRVTKKLVVE